MHLEQPVKWLSSHRQQRVGQEFQSRHTKQICKGICVGKDFQIQLLKISIVMVVLLFTQYFQPKRIFNSLKGSIQVPLGALRCQHTTIAILCVH